MYLPATIVWRPLLSPGAGGLVIMLLVLLLGMSGRRLLQRHGGARGALLIAPRVLVLILLVAALFDPAWMLFEEKRDKAKLLIVTDVSSSMDVADRDNTPRSDRASDLRKRLSSELKRDVEIETAEFDTEFRTEPASGPGGERGTDLGKCLVALDERPGLRDYAGVVVLTDGGDEQIRAARVPGTSLFIVGIGGERANVNDLLFEDVAAPKTVEQDTDFEVVADVKAFADAAFAARLGDVRVLLEQQEDEEWTRVDLKRLDLTAGAERVTFKIEGQKEFGPRRYRLSIASVDGELTPLNNTRELTVVVERKSLPVLFFSRQLGWDGNILRKTLDRDSGVSLTALSRVTGERYLVQGDRQERDEGIEAGFPNTAELLKLYKCVILGSFQADELGDAQFKALQEYVEQGGSVVFLGGDESFALGGYGGTTVGALLPWSIADATSELLRGPFSANITVGASEHELVSGLGEKLAAAGPVELLSVNRVGPIKPGAVSLLESSAHGETVAVIALQPYGDGLVLGIATNTLWKWERAGGSRREAYAAFWKQAIRYLAGMTEGGRFLSVRWDRQLYRPSEEAEIAVSVAGRYAAGALRLTGTCEHGGTAEPLDIESRSGRDNAFRCTARFSQRGEYNIHIEAHAGDRLLEAYDKRLEVGPAVPEGANIDVNHAFLDRLASRTAGRYAKETEWKSLVPAIRERVISESVTRDVPLVELAGVYPSLLLLALVLEWIIRRKQNLF